MLRLALMVAAPAALVSSCSEHPSEPDVPTSALVSMPGFSFTPFTTTIAVGGSVTYDFPNEPHNVIFQRVSGAPTDIQETVNRKVSRTFSSAGSFPYDCTLHPGMSGVVIAR